MYIQDTMKIAERNKVQAPKKINPNIPSSLSKLALHCLETLPASRPSNMFDVGKRLGKIMKDDLGVDPER